MGKVVRRLVIVLAMAAVAGFSPTAAFADDMAPGPGSATKGSSGAGGQTGSPGQSGSAGNKGSSGGTGQSGSSSQITQRPISQPASSGGGTGTRSVGPTEDFVNSNLPADGIYAPAVDLMPGPEPAPAVGKMPAVEEPAQGPAISTGQRAAAVGFYLLACLGIAVAATVLIPMDLITRIFGAGPPDRTGSHRASVRG